MKKISTFICTLILFFGFAAAGLSSLQAQDINTAIETFNAGVTAVQEGNTALAIENFRKALEIAAGLGEDGVKVVADCKNSIPSLHLKYAQELANEDKMDEAFEQLAKAVETSERYDDANNIVQEAQNLYAPFYIKKANAAMNAKDFAAAVENYRKALETDADNAVACLRLGMAESSLGKTEEAVAALEKAAEMGEKAKAYKYLSKIYLKQALVEQKAKAWPASYEAAKKAVSYADEVQGNKLLGLSAIQLKKYDEALAAWLKVEAANPEAKDINSTRYRLALCYEGLGQKAEACKMYKAIAADPNFKAMAEYKIKTVLKCE